MDRRTRELNDVFSAENFLIMQIKQGDLTGLIIVFALAAVVPLTCGRFARRLVRQSRHEIAAWIAVIGAGLSALQFYIWAFVLRAWDTFSWPVDVEGIYIWAIFLALILGFFDCSIRFVCLVAWDMKRGPSTTKDNGNSS
jgi:hypothetical protein